MNTHASSFYVTGGTLRPDASSYVERQADADLYDGLRRAEYCYVLTPRQMGKSSLMVRAATRLRGEGVAVVVLDLAAIGQNLSPEQWYDGLLARVGEQLDLEEELEGFWLAHPRLSPLQRWMAALREVVLARCPGRVVFFVDEIDVVRSLPFSADEFFAAIREAYNRRAQDPEFARLAFCLLGVASPADLITDARTSPFNIGRRIELTDFTAAEAEPLAAGLLTSPPAPPRNGEGCLSPVGHSGEPNVTSPRGVPPGKQAPPPRFGEGAGGRGQTLLERVLYWTGGQPYLTQRLCRTVAEDEQATSPADVDRLCDGLFLTRKAREVDDNLAFVRNWLLRAEVDLASLLELYGRVRRGKPVVDDETDPLVTLLRLSGVVRPAGGMLRVCNRIYDRVFDREWVVAHMPEAELRRQRAAYRRGLARASAIAGTVLVMLGALAFTAVSQAARARRGEGVARLETLRANAKAEEARSLLARLQLALREKDQAFDRLRASLKEEKTQRQRATQAAKEARTAQGRERAQFLRANTARGEAERERQAAVAQREAADRARGQAVTQRRRAEDEARRARRNLYFADMSLAQQDWEAHNLVRLRQLLHETQANPERGFEWAYWMRRCQPERATFRARQASTIVSVAFSPNGRRVVMASGNGAQVWDAATGRELLRIGSHAGRVLTVAFSPDGRRILTGGADAQAKLWDAETGRETLTLRGHTQAVLGVAFSPDGGRIVTGSADNTARVWDADTGRGILTLRGHTNGVVCVAFSPDGRRIATGGSDTSARVWDAATGHQILTLKGTMGEVHSVAFSPDGKRIVLGASDDSMAWCVRVWDAETGGEILTLQGHTGDVFAVAYSPDGHRIATGSADHTAKLWDATTGREIRTLWGHTSAVRAIAFSPDGSRLLTGSWDGTARVWSATGEPEMLTLGGQINAVRSFAFSPDGRRMVTASRGDNTATVWDVATGDPILALRGHEAPVWSVAFSRDGRWIATGSLDHTARIWNAATGQPALTLPGHAGWVLAVAFSADGRRLLTAGRDGTTKVWDAATGRPLLTVRAPDRGAGTIALSPSNQRVLALDRNRRAEVWDTAMGGARIRLRGHAAPMSAIAFSADGRRILTGSEDHTAKVWDATTGREIRTLQGHTDAVSAVGFSGDGRRVLTGGLDGTVRVWDAETGRETLTFPGHLASGDTVRVSGPTRLTLKGSMAPISSVAFSPDGQRIVAGTVDGTVRVWEAASPPQIAAWAAAERAAPGFSTGRRR